MYYYPGFSLAACHYSALAFQGINSCQVPIYMYLTWAKCGTCRLMPCQTTLCRVGDRTTTFESQVKCLNHSTTTLLLNMDVSLLCNCIKHGNVALTFHFNTKCVFFLFLILNLWSSCRNDTTSHSFEHYFKMSPFNIYPFLLTFYYNTIPFFYQPIHTSLCQSECTWYLWPFILNLHLKNL